MNESFTIVVLEGDETGQELLEQALRILDTNLMKIDICLEYFDLSLNNRRKTKNHVVYEACERIKETGFGLKAATITPH